MSLLSVIYKNMLNITPRALPQNGNDTDWLTILFFGLLILITLIIVNGRRKFSLIIRALFSARSRSQLLRESKPLGEWIYAFLLTYVFLTQGILFYLLISHFAAPVAAHFSAPLLWLTCAAVCATDYTLKRINVFFLTGIFECPEDRNNFKQNKFFYQVCNSLALLPILMITVYTGWFSCLFFYIPFFLTSYLMMLYQTLHLKSGQLNLFQFFLYFCTLEILPYLIILKILTNIS